MRNSDCTLFNFVSLSFLSCASVLSTRWWSLIRSLLLASLLCSKSRSVHFYWPPCFAPIAGGMSRSPKGRPAAVCVYKLQPAKQPVAPLPTANCWRIRGEAWVQPPKRWDAYFSGGEGTIFRRRWITPSSCSFPCVKRGNFACSCSSETARGERLAGCALSSVLGAQLYINATVRIVARWAQLEERKRLVGAGAQASRVEARRRRQHA